MPLHRIATVLSLAVVLISCGEDVEEELSRYEIPETNIIIPKDIYDPDAKPIEVEREELMPEEEVIEAGVDPEAERVLSAWSEALAGASTMRFDAVTKVHYEVGGESQQEGGGHAIAMARPNRLSAQLVEGVQGVSLVSNGQRVFLYFPAERNYLEQPAPPALPSLVMMAASGQNTAHLLFCTVLLSPDPMAAVLSDAPAVEYRGREEVDGREAHHILCQALDQSITWHMWITTGDEPRVVRVAPMVPAWSYQLKQQVRSAEATLDVDIRFSNWELGPELSRDVFVFNPPPGAERIAADEMGGPMTQSTATALEGQEAPSFTLPLLGGGEASLSDHLGSEVVVLDFWATWCAPCRESLPKLAEALTNREGVAFYAVNREERPEQIRPFLEELGVAPPVALDAAGNVSTGYGANMLPTTVVIGLDGVVRQAFIGAAPDIEEQVVAAVESALAGEPMEMPSAPGETPPPGRPAPPAAGPETSAAPRP